MRLDAVTVCNVTRFAGPVTLNLRELPEGLVALIGPNGEGKTTLLESGVAALIREFPTRAEKELVDYATERDGYIEALFSVVGQGQYRARVNLDGVKRNSDAVLELIGPDGRPHLLNDGKVSTFDQAVARIFPSRDVLLASAFSAQNRAGSFVSLDKRGRKDLFARLLGLERLEAMAQTAREAGNIYDQTRTQLRGRRDVLARAGAPEVFEAIDRDEQALDADRHQAETARLRWAGAVDVLEKERTTVTAEAQEHAAAAAKLVVLAGQASELQQRGPALEARRGLAEKGKAAEHGSAALELEQTVAGIDERIRNNRAVLDAADDIRAAAAESVNLAARITGLQKTIDDLNTELDAVTARHAADNKRVMPLRQADADLAAAMRDAGTLGTVPCGGTGDYAGCSFLTRAQAAAAKIPALSAASAGLEAVEAALLQHEQDRLAGLSARTEATRAKQELERLIVGVAAKAALLANITTAEARIVELQADRAKAEQSYATAVASADERFAAFVAVIEDELRAHWERVDEIGADVADTREIAERTAGAAERLGSIDRELTDARAQLDAVRTTSAHLESRSRSLADARAAFNVAQAALADLDGRIRTVEDELLAWQLLAKALGKDGLPTLEIDAAGPTVSSYCNDLLAVCFGPRFTVELVTQVAKADGKGVKEAFDLRVYDNLRGGEPRDLGDLSGGELVLVDEALKNALALFVNARNVAPIETCWRDETTGPLDAENAGRYLEMLRRVRTIGGFHQILFVTHNRDAANGADAQVRVAGGGLTTALPPFAEAA